MCECVEIECEYESCELCLRRVHTWSSVYILHLWIFEENAVDCVLCYQTTERQFQNKSLLGRICKFAGLP